MNTSIIPSDTPAIENIRVRPIDGQARRFVLGLLGELKRGQITILDGPHRHVF